MPKLRAKKLSAKSHLKVSYFKPIDIKRLARVPYQNVIRWLEQGHPRAGVLRSIDLAETGKRHSYRIHPEDWAAFEVKLSTASSTRGKSAPPTRAARTQESTGVFRY